MIGKLKGIIDTTEKDSLILDVHGVGYIVFCSARTLRALPAAGEAVALIIETHVREEAINLYGFMDGAERDWFRLLVTVKGVGSKVALSILGILSPSHISSAIAVQDKTAFRQVSGVGPKLAERILVELKGKSAGEEAFSPASSLASGAENDSMADAVSALANLGYSRTEAYNVVSKLLKGDDTLSISDLIRKALKELAK